jgi:hypothetical protein
MTNNSTKSLLWATVWIQNRHCRQRGFKITAVGYAGDLHSPL